MFNKKSEHALNKKDSAAIVYTDAYGNIFRITEDDFDSVKEFRKWKNWANMKNHSEEKKEHIHRNHTISLSLIEGAVGTESNMESRIILSDEQDEQIRRSAVLIKRMKGCLSQKQYRRLWLYHVERMDTYQIAAIEGITHQSVSESIQSARKKIIKFLQKHPAKF